MEWCLNVPHSWLSLVLFMLIEDLILMTKDRRLGHAFFLGTNLVFLSSKKQCVIAQSNTEVKYQSLSYAATKVIWLEALLKETCLSSSYVPILWCDNLSIITLDANPMLYTRTKHMERNIHFIHERS